MTDYSSFFIPFIAFITTAIAIVILERIAHKVGLLDIPGGRKQHGCATPLVGGIGIYIGMIVGLFCLPFPVWFSYTGFIAGSFLILLIGVLDDIYDISPKIRLLVQFAALLIMVFWGHVQLYQLGPLFGKSHLHLKYWGIPLTVFGAATLINAMNMLDGLDGFAGSIALAALGSLFGIAYVSGLYAQTLVLGVILGALIAFLCFNFPFWPSKKASLFMGDAGSTLLGFILAWFTIELSQAPETIAPPALMLWIVAVPIMDLAVVFLKRLKQGRSPFKPGNEHIYYVLMERGLSRVQVLWVVLALALMMQGVAWGMMLNHWPDSGMLSVFIFTFLIYSVFSFFLHKKSVV